MLLKQTLEILEKLLTKCEVTEVLITKSEEVVHYETDEPEFVTSHFIKRRVQGVK